ncbi:hypothetical protein [Winogradskyella sp. SYSU M77433]|uniref:hypothetical protein n=1 Tax=Winogradskyella sp. SYSU M77433 TaxID=3042722 RepID=UPI002480CA78|nr:hypothetical protein [Winogradskyella sp. SYSU M77433]MDH7911550.1 hypothetical protein [Winogradskyella sp. SYSU M77433]
MITSCYQAEKKERTQLKKNEPIIQEIIVESSEFEEKESPQFIENDSIIHLWESELKSLTKEYSNFVVKTELIENDHDNTQIDTIRTLTFDKSKIVVYSTTGFYAVWTADIKNSELPIWNYVKVGMKKHQLEKTLATRLKSDTIKFGNLEQTSLFEFYFSNEELKQVKFEGYID